MDIGASLWATAIQTSESGAAITKTRHIGCRWGYASLVYETDSVMFPQAKATGLTVKDWQDLIMVNQFGKRFWDEGDGSYKFFNAAMAYNGDKTKLNGGGPIWAIFDADGAAREKWNTKPPNVDPDGWFYQADTLAELAGRIKNQYQKQPMPGAALTETVARYNSFVADGVDKDFKKKTPMHKIEKPPFYAAWATPILHDTLTGLAHQHLDRGGRHARRGDPEPLLRGRIAGRLRPARAGALPRVRPHRRAHRGEELGLSDDGGYGADGDAARRGSKRALRSGTSRPRSRRASAFPSRPARSLRPAARSAGAASRCWTAMLSWPPVLSAMRHGPAPTRSTGPRSSCARRRPPGTVTFSVRFDAGDLDEPHQDASSPFNVSVVARPDHTLTVKVASGGMPIEEAYIRLGPYRAHHRRIRAGRDQTGGGPLRACGLEGGIRHGAGAAHDRRGCLRRCRGAGAAAGRSRRGLDGMSAVI